MIIFPSYDCSFESNKNPEEIYTILKSVVEPQKSYFFHVERAEFIGEVSSRGFKIYKNIGYRNSFLPVIRGSVEVRENKTEVVIKMRMHRFITAFITLWLCGVGLFLILGIMDAFKEGTTEALSLLSVPAGIIVFEQILSRLCFYIPAKNSIRRLEELLR